MAAARQLGLRAAGLRPLLCAAGAGPVSGPGRCGRARVRPAGRALGVGALSRPLASPQAPASVVWRSVLGIAPRAGEFSGRDAPGAPGNRFSPCVHFAGGEGVAISSETAAPASGVRPWVRARCSRCCRPPTAPGQVQPLPEGP